MFWLPRAKTLWEDFFPVWSSWPSGSSLCLATGSSLSWVSTTIVRADSSARCSRLRFFGRHSKVSVGSSSASSSMLSWRIFCMKSSGSHSCLRNLILIGFCPSRTFSTASCIQLVFLASLSVAFSVGSGLRMVCATFCWDESSRVHLGVCFSRSCRLFVAFFGVVSGPPLFLGLMVRMGGTNNVSHCATPV